MPSEAARREVAIARRKLSRQFPVPYPVRIRWVTPGFLKRVTNARCDGSYLYWHEPDDAMKPLWALIRLSHACNQDVAVDTVKHEWAHLLRHLIPGYDPEKDPHDAIFWAIVGEIERWWHGENKQ